jgi:hypothetical protein
VTAAAGSTPALVTWVVLALLLGLVLGAAAATLLAGRRGAGADAPAGPDAATPPVPGAPRVLEVDDLPGFLEHPPGSPAPAPATAATTPTAAATAPGGRATPAQPARQAGAGAGRHSPADLSARSTLLSMVVAAAVLVLVAVVIALVGGGDDQPDGAPASSPSPAAVDDTTSSPARTPPTTEPVSDDVQAGALAARSVEPGDEGMAARATFGTVLLERRAVGVTVTRPGLTVSSDGKRALAHVLLPTFNCLVPDPPPDPEAAGCARGATEYAELTGPDLRLSRDGARLELAGLAATYTRPPAGPATYTGRSYRLRATLAADGPERDGSTPARGVLELGAHSAPTTGGPDANVLQLRD